MEKTIIYDFETNGMWNRLTQPIQVCFKIIEPDGKEWTYSDYVQCPWKIPHDVVQLTGITNDLLLEKGKDIREVFENIRNILFVPDVIIKLVGHHILRFDNLFLNYYLQKFFTNRFQIGKELCFDTAAMFKATKLGLTPSPELSIGEWHHKVLYMKSKGVTYTLAEACEFYGIDYKNAHSAGGDVDMTYLIYLQQMQYLKKAKKRRSTKVKSKLLG